MGISATDVAKQTKEDPSMVFKTLVTVSKDKDNFVFVIPGEGSLDLKAAAKLVGSKKIEMLEQKSVEPLTGYVHGGCSPIGMKKHLKTFIHQSALDLDYIFVSAGQIGLQLKIDPRDLARFIGADFADLII